MTLCYLCHRFLQMLSVFFDISVLHPQRCYPRGTGLLILKNNDMLNQFENKKSTVPIESMYGIFADIHIFTCICLIVLAKKNHGKYM